LWLAAQFACGLTIAFLLLDGFLIVKGADSSVSAAHSRAWLMILIGTVLLVMMIPRWRWGVPAAPAALILVRIARLSFASWAEGVIVVGYSALTLLLISSLYRRKSSLARIDYVVILANVYCVCLAVSAGESARGALYLGGSVVCVAIAAGYHLLVNGGEHDRTAGL
jgi:hypothetical protein